MAQGKQTPRQKMINLMYLIFIAMLAMQIDQEIIRSYKDTNTSLESNRSLTQDNNDRIFEKTLKAKAENSPETFGTPYNQYMGLKQKANDLVSFIDGLKAKMSKEAQYDARAEISESFAALNNTEPSTANFFIDGSENKPSKTAADLKAKMDAMKKYINDNFGSNPQLKGLVDRANMQLLNEFQKAENNKNWIQYKFYNQPLIAALSNLEVIGSNARGIQADALSNMLQEKVDANIKFDAYSAIVSAPTTVVQGAQGEEAKAVVAIGNYSSSVPGLNMPGLSLQNGQGIGSLNTGALGEHHFSGNVTFNDVNGKPISLAYDHVYNVVEGTKSVAFESGALLTADKMNVLYRGLPNPVSGSILGANNSQTNLTASGASVTKTGGGTWTVTPGAGNAVTLTISGSGPKGAISKEFKFRIKNIPPPVGTIQGKNVISMPASAIPNQHVAVDMPDFDFPVSFTVNSFMFKVNGKAAMMVTGNSLSAVTGLTKGLRSGDIAYVFNIQATATGLNGQVLKQIPAVVINVQ